ncbi:sensor histidine kinase [Pseudarcicella hirudinis]|uniref:sensor histidine kinase n=1 Tax=Pseudarcicella hirudinis TaxID=1079859 RepID=UPI0035E9AF5B
MDRNRRIHWILWIVYIFYTDLLIYIYDGGGDLLKLSVLLFEGVLKHALVATVFYINALYILPSFLKPKKYFLLAVNLICLIGLYIFFRYVLTDYVIPFFERVEPKPVLFWSFVTDSLWFVNIYLFFSLGYYFALKSIEQEQHIAKQQSEIALREREIRILQEQKSKAEMAFLRAQINPHFMYNTLNMIYQRVKNASPQAGEIVLTFSEMMRYATSTQMNKDKVMLEEEVKFVKDYIDLHLQRFNYTICVDFEEEGDFDSYFILPMVLITLVENAFKHGELRDPDNPLTIKAILRDNIFTFSTRNLKVNYAMGIHDEGTGVGVSNIQQRLEAVHGTKQKMEIIDLPDEYICIFTLNFN